MIIFLSILIKAVKLHMVSGFTFHIKQINQSKNWRMTNRQIKLVLPNLTSKAISQEVRESIINIPYGTQTHNSVPSHKPSKWLIRESHVQRHISNKKYKPAMHISVNQTSKINKTAFQQHQRNMFFTGVNNTDVKTHIGKQEKREKSIQKSRQFVDLVKSHRKNLLKIRMITQPQRTDPNSPKEKQSKQLYSYLQRNFINDRHHKINNKIIEKFKTQSPQRLFEKIQEKSRKFLLQKMHKDYKNYVQIDSYKRQSIKSLIQEQIQRKKKDFKQDYNKRYSSPYFSFLSLSNQQRENILHRRQLHLNSI